MHRGKPGHDFSGPDLLWEPGCTAVRCNAMQPSLSFPSPQRGCSPVEEGKGEAGGSEPEGWGREKVCVSLVGSLAAHAGNSSAAGISDRQKEYLREDLGNRFDGGGWFCFL